ncbi:hypothetical protein AAJP47_00010 [Psychrobacter sp. B38]|uniref:hypothetical protein n=1 Tax=Psychrobacter sp. B38 TaxID=3143538 RepID=UPI00320D6216
MESKSVFLAVVICSAAGFVGCQSMTTKPTLSQSDANHQVEQVRWKKSGEPFRQHAADNNLKNNESRIVFFHDTDNSAQSKNINISMGLDNTFHSSLKNEQHSEQIVCYGSHIVNASIMNGEDGSVISYRENYQLLPQTTTYLKVSLSNSGHPMIHRLTDDEALPLLDQTLHQAHHISRVLSDCNTVKQKLSGQVRLNQNTILN